jgi:hypothetical protein
MRVARGVVGVLTGPRPVEAWGCYRHTHVIPSVRELPKLIETEFCLRARGYEDESSGGVPWPGASIHVTWMWGLPEPRD